MARKRKKSKGREKRRKKQKTSASPKAAADGTGVPTDVAEEEAEATDQVESEASEGADDGREAADAAAGEADDTDQPSTSQPDRDAPQGDTEKADDPPSRRVATVIEVDQELEDPDARAELIAAAAALAAEDEEEAAAEVGDAGDHPVDGDSREPDDGAPVESDDDAPSEPQVEEPPGDGGDEEPGDGGTPLIGRDALIALSQFRDEGVATVPEELILDLGEVTAPDERDRLLAAALAHVEMQEAIYRVPTDSPTTRGWKGLIAAGIFVLAVLLAAMPPAMVVPARPEPLSEADRLRGIRTALLVQAEQIEAFRVREERLPASLAEVETALPGMRFVKSSNRLYQLVAYTPDGDAIIYDSAAPDSAFADMGSPLVPADAP